MTTPTLIKTDGHTSRLTYKQLKERVLKNPASSFWLKGAITSLESRDVLDAQLDVAYLSKLYDIRLREALPTLEEPESKITVSCCSSDCRWEMVMDTKHAADWHNLSCPRCHDSLLIGGGITLEELRRKE